MMMHEDNMTVEQSMAITMLQQAERRASNMRMELLQLVTSYGDGAINGDELADAVQQLVVSQIQAQAQS